jgi:hypothetical protein
MMSNRIRIASLRAFAWAGFLCVALTFPTRLSAQDGLYQQGLAAYQSGDDLNAVKFLFAYKQLASGSVTPAFAQQLDTALNFSERRVRAALSSSGSVESGGKFDSPGAGKEPNRPTLPSSPGASKAAPPRNVIIAQPVAGADAGIKHAKIAAAAEVVGSKSTEEQLAELQKANAELQQQLTSCQQMLPRKKPQKKVPDQ